MKKTMIIAFLAMSSLLFAQQTNTAFKQDTEKLVSIVSGETFKIVIDQLDSLVPQDKKEAFKKEVEKTMPELFSKISEIYMEEFTHKEIKGLLEFYSTPLGKKMSSKTGILAQKGMLAGQQWGLKLQGIVEKYN